MPDASSADGAAAPKNPPAQGPLPKDLAVAMNLMALWPFMHLAGVAALVLAALSGFHPLACGLGVPVVLYLLPPLVAAPARAWALVPGLHDLGTSQGRRLALRWWWSVQAQTPFARFPALEELLRLLPLGAYSAWLRLWGAQVGRFVYWAPGTCLLDRPLLRLGGRVVVGAGVRLHGHVLLPHRGRMHLLIGPLKVGDGAMLGGFCVLLPGCEIAPGATTTAGQPLRAFQAWPSRRKLYDLPDLSSKETP